ncbi:MAG: Glu-tRNA(Gln) amidotransferase subunit GatE, partial [Thermoplasmata archaeon]|nr:Glu-tRNA(Gln) amidotransferase subunit GatE [Thermoplasmata archaeon]
MPSEVKIGIEIHQQLDTHKLFCSCPSELKELKGTHLVRYLRPTRSELGEVDIAALSEARKALGIRYESGNTCLVEADEEPPHEVNQEAVEIALGIGRLFHADTVDELHFMRKIVIDGSNTTGFQRTGLVAMNGHLNTSKGVVGIDVICLEEDAARKISEKGKEKVYRLDRLGIPLVEVTTKPDIVSGEHAKETASLIGAYLRATGRVKRGLGTIRQDLNVSIPEGARVELKGVQDLRSIP